MQLKRPIQILIQLLRSFSANVATSKSIIKLKETVEVKVLAFYEDSKLKDRVTVKSYHAILKFNDAVMPNEKNFDKISSAYKLFRATDFFLKCLIFLF